MSGNNTYRGIHESLHNSRLSGRLHATNDKSNEGSRFVQLILVEFVDIGDEGEEIILVLREQFGKLGELLICCITTSCSICLDLPSIAFISQGFGLSLLLPAFKTFGSTINRHGWLLCVLLSCWASCGRTLAPAVGTRLIDLLQRGISNATCENFRGTIHLSAPTNFKYGKLSYVSRQEMSRPTWGRLFREWNTKVHATCLLMGISHHERLEINFSIKCLKRGKGLCMQLPEQRTFLTPKSKSITKISKSLSFSSLLEVEVEVE